MKPSADAVHLLEARPCSGARSSMTRAHVDLVERGEDRRRVLRLHQALGDALAEAASSARARLVAGARAPRGAVRRGIGRDGASARRRGGVACWWRDAVSALAACEMRQHVALGQPPAACRCPDRARIEAVLLDEPAHGRARRDEPRLQSGAAAAPAGCGRRWRGRRLRRCAARRLVPVALRPALAPRRRRRCARRRRRPAPSSPSWLEDRAARRALGAGSRRWPCRSRARERLVGGDVLAVCLIQRTITPSVTDSPRVGI